MAELAVNLILIAAVLVLVVTWAASGTRRRRQDRREHAEERRLILHAALGAAATPPGSTAPASGGGETVPVAARDGQQLDAASVAALLDLLEKRSPARRGLFADLVGGPSSIWAAGARAGQHVGRRTMGDRGRAATRDDPSGAPVDDTPLA